MKTRILGRHGPQITVIGFGAWAIGGPWIYGWGKVDDTESIRTIHRAIDLGVNWIDTAAAYGLGHSEEVVGKAVRGIREKVFLATKCGLVPDGKGDVYRSSRPESMRKEIEASLGRLQTDHVDLFQIHWPDASVPLEESWQTMVRFKEEGKTRHIGVSNYEPAMLDRCRNIASVQSLQAPYSMLTRDIDRGTLPYCERHGIGVVVYSPMQSGLLSGKFNLSKLAPDDWRRKNSWFQEPHLSKALDFVEGIRPIAERYHRTVGQLAIQWVLRKTGVTAAIVGARRPEQIEETVGAADFEISSEDLKAIDQSLSIVHSPQ